MRVLMVAPQRDDHHLVTGLRRLGCGVEVVESIDGLADGAVAGASGVVWSATPAPETQAELCELRARTQVPLVLVSDETRPDQRARLLDAGADDLLDRPVDPDELRARLEATRRRAVAATNHPASVLAVDGLRLDLDARWVEVDGSDIRLTPTEWRLLDALVQGAGRLVTYEEIIATVWSPRHGREARDSLRAHLRSLRRKLGDDAEAPRFVATEPGQGCRWLARAH